MVDKKITFIVSAYNEEPYIEDTLNSLKNVAKKTHLKSHEIIVIDDGSYDKTPEKLQKITKKSPNILAFRNTNNKGLGFSLRRGISKATGEKIIMDFLELENWTH